jgi:hypothetical protein
VGDVTGDGAQSRVYAWMGPSTLMVDVESATGTLLARLDSQIPSGLIARIQPDYTQLVSLVPHQGGGDAGTTSDIRVALTDPSDPLGNMEQIFEAGRSIKSTPDPGRAHLIWPICKGCA